MSSWQNNLIVQQQRYGALPTPPAVIDPRTAQASINPPDLQSYARDSAWTKAQVYYPEILVPNNPNISLQAKYYPVSTTFDSAGNTYTARLNFETPTTVYAITAGTFSTAGAALLAGTQVFWQELNTFTIYLERSMGDKLFIDAVLGGAVCGTGKFPGMIGGGGWMFSTGQAMTINLKSLVATQQLTVGFWCVEMRGPANFSWPQG